MRRAEKIGGGLWWPFFHCDWLEAMQISNLACETKGDDTTQLPAGRIASPSLYDLIWVCTRYDPKRLVEASKF